MWLTPQAQSLYAVAASSSLQFPLQRQGLALVSADFEFASIACNYLNQACAGHRLIVLQVLPNNETRRIGDVAAKVYGAGPHAEALDRRFRTSTNACLRSHCHMRLRRSLDIVCGIQVCADWQQPATSGSCDIADNATELVELNALHPGWTCAASAAARDALYSAKLSYSGPRYFARASQDKLPPDVLDRIVSLAQQKVRIVPVPKEGPSYWWSTAASALTEYDQASLSKFCRAKQHFGYLSVSQYMHSKATIDSAQCLHAPVFAFVRRILTSSLLSLSYLFWL